LPGAGADYVGRCQAELQGYVDLGVGVLAVSKHRALGLTVPLKLCKWPPTKSSNDWAFLLQCMRQLLAHPGISAPSDVSLLSAPKRTLTFQPKRDDKPKNAMARQLLDGSNEVR
jgi:hypothetical protein